MGNNGGCAAENLTVRDVFAGIEMAVLAHAALRTPTAELDKEAARMGCKTREEFIAKVSYRLADAMLAAREVQP